MKIQSPWMGRIKGSAGNMTGCKVYDKNVMRAKAFEVSNPNTQAQQTQRNFFSQVVDCCESVSEEQLRSLFGVKPKSMSRRNALTKQLSAAFTINGNNKSLDFTKIVGIGNGSKVTTPLGIMQNGSLVQNKPITLDMFGDNADENTTAIFIMFDADTNTIKFLNINAIASTISNLQSCVLFGVNIQNGSFYATCATDGGDASQRDFGTFTIKTRTNN